MVMDFGIAKAVSAAGSETLTQTGMMVGTPRYVSPEQAAGEINLDGKSDQYSLACMLYEMIAGERPFTGTTPQAIMAKRFTETPKPLRVVRAVRADKRRAGGIEGDVDRGLGAIRDVSSVRAGARYPGSLSTPTDTATLAEGALSQPPSRSRCFRSRT